MNNYFRVGVARKNNKALQKAKTGLVNSAVVNGVRVTKLTRANLKEEGWGRVCRLEEQHQQGAKHSGKRKVASCLQQKQAGRSEGMHPGKASFECLI